MNVNEFCDAMKYVNDKFLHSDLIVLGCIATINCYILLVMGKIIDGMDVFLKSLSLFQVIGILLSLIIVQTLIELYVRYINKGKTAFLVSRFILGVFVMFMAYILVVTTGGSSGYDGIIKNMTSWEFYNLMTIEFMFFCFAVVYEKAERKRYQNKSSDDVSC